MAGNLRSVVLIWIALACSLGGCASLGTLQGNLELTSASPDVGSYLAMHATLPGAPGAVKLYDASDLASIQTTSYIPASGAVPGGFLVGTYSAGPSVADSGTTSFFVEVDTLRMPNATYRIGTRGPGVPDAQQSPPVPPLATVPFNVVEPACLVSATLRLTGSDEDFDALQSSEFACNVYSASQEPNGRFIQATSDRSSLQQSTLRQEGVTIELLYRQGASLHAACGTVPPAGSGFAVNDIGRAIFLGQLTSATGSCVTKTTQAYDVPVQRIAGVLTGLFDVSGETEASAQIVAVRSGAARRTATPVLTPAGQIPGAGDRWRIEGLQPETYDVYAWTRLRGGDALSALPHRWGANLPVVVADAPPEHDLGSTFISRATPVSGKFRLLDPSGRTELRTLATRSLPDSIDEPFVGRWSFLYVIGDPQALAGGTSGESARGYARLRGAAAASDTGCSSSTDSCELDYTLLLTGLSRSDAPRDGSGTLATQYNHSGVNLSYGTDTSNSQRGFGTIIVAEPRLAASATAAPVALDPLNVCVGQVDYSMTIDPAYGSLYAPSLSGNGTVSSANTRFSPSVVGRFELRDALGLPRIAAEAATRVRVLATLPEGARYLLRPRVQFKPASGAAATHVSLRERNFPVGTGSVLGCGQIAGACERINNSDTGESTLLSIGIGDPPQCSASAGLSMTVRVESGGENVPTLTYQVDAGPEISLCANASCGPDPVRPLPAQGQPPLNPPPGAIVTIRASSQNGCDAVYLYTAPAACNVPVATPRYQLAFFDEGRLKIHDLTTGSAVADLATAPGLLRYSRDGAKLAVVTSLSVNVLDADNPGGPALDAITGEHADAAFNPTDSGGLALLQGPTSSGGFILSVRRVPGPGVLGPVAVATGSGAGTPEAFRPRPRLAWSQDGTRVTVAYSVRTAGGTQQLRSTEWRIANGTLEPVPGRNLQFPLVSSELFRGFAYNYAGGGEGYVFATSRGIYLHQGSGSLQLLLAQAIDQADVHRNALHAAAPGGLAPASMFAEAILVEPNAFGYLALIEGLAVSDYPAPNVSRSFPMLAVARRPQSAAGIPAPGRVTLFEISSTAGPNNTPGLSRVGVFPATNPSRVAFRPLPP